MATSVAGKTIYVDTDAVSTNDASTWSDTYKFLQDDLADANFIAKPVEIRVAQGIYKPNQDVNQTLGDRNATFLSSRVLEMNFCKTLVRIHNFSVNPDPLITSVVTLSAGKL